VHGHHRLVVAEVDAGDFADLGARDRDLLALAGGDRLAGREFTVSRPITGTQEGTAMRSWARM
jgi:hypothetical protein